MTFPTQLRGVVPAETAAAWMSIRDLVPAGAYLGGGTAIALHLHHRTSRDLDFFLRQPIDLDRLVAALRERGRLAVEQFDAEPGRQTLNAYLDRTKLRFLEASSLRLVEPLVPVAGLQVAGLGDLLAMKLKVVRDRGELRDYYDLLVIERDGRRRAEEGIALALHKYRPRAVGAFVESVVRGLSYLDDVEEDPAVPLSKAEVAAYWRSRVPEIARSLSRLG
jgi:hypothetical protein